MSASASVPKSYKTPERLLRPGVGVDSIWVEFVGLTNKHKALNLGQGFPTFLPPDHVIENLTQVGDKYLLNQYTRGFGHPPLIAALKDMYDPLLNRDLDAQKEIIVTVGAYGSLFCAIQAMVSEGDEVIIIEPFFDCYAPMVNMAGGSCKYVPIRPPTDGSDPGTTANWAVDLKELEAAFTDKTKALIINNPNNPLGKVFRRDELEAIANIVKKKDVLCIADEVYEHMTYPGATMHRMATIPDMWDRTFTIGSAGKTFSVTGWKLGWCVAPEYLIKNMGYVWQNVCYTSPTPIQEACANSFRIEMERQKNGDKNCYFTSLADEMLPLRDRMAAMLKKAGMKPIVPEGGYFMAADASGMGIDIPKEFYDDSVTWDHNLARYLISEEKLSTIPNSAFYSTEGKKENNKYLRFCFAKDEATMQKAEKFFDEWAAKKN